MKIKEYAGIKHIVIDKMIKNEKELYKALEDKVFFKSYYINKFYPVIINNSNIIFVYKNSHNFIHFYIKNKKYRFNKKHQIIYSNMLVTTNEYRRLIDKVKLDNKKIFENNGGCKND